MAALVLFSVCFLCLMTGVSTETRESYMRRRSRLRDTDDSFRYGEAVHLTAVEQLLDKRITAMKKDEFKQGMASEIIAPGVNFMTVIDMIDQSKVFQMIKRMPKGAALHVHLLAMIDPSWLIGQSTYRPDCYMCINQLGAVRFHIARHAPTTLWNCTNWRRVIDVRSEYKSPAIFDELLRLNLTILTKHPNIDFPNINVVWQRADKTWPAIADLAFYRDILPEFLTEVMRQFLNDGVQYFETRGSLYATYDYDRHYTPEESLIIMRNAVQKFKQTNPDFIGVKYITELGKYEGKEKVGKAVLDAVDLHRKYPDFLAGFDLVAQEDPTNPIIHYLDQLLIPSQMDPPYKLPYFFHAGETNWEGTHIDENLYDALLLNASRIGHGYASVKHRRILDKLRENDVALELNPVSNQVLLLVNDLRNHPAAYLLANNYSVIVSSDDPGIWNALPLSHDFYELFMGCMPMDQGLKPLKRLAMDSIRYSAMSDSEKADAYTKWMHKWNTFVGDEILYHHVISQIRVDQTDENRVILRIGYN